MRCLTLADTLRKRGEKCSFISRAHQGNLIDLIAERGYAVVGLPKATSKMRRTFSKLTHAPWLGADWVTDAEQTRHALGKEIVDWLIVDHYALDHRWESVIRAACKRIMVIDDLADRRHDGDLFLDQNYGSSPVRYEGLLPEYCKQLHGPQYALLKPEYSERLKGSVARTSGIRRVLIYFGGGEDRDDLTGMALQAFIAPKLANIELDIIVGAAYAHKSSLEDTATQRGHTAIHSQLPDLANLMASADLAIGAGGATTWERCCLGLPSIVISVADNQRPACEALAAEGMIEYLGERNSITTAQFRDRVLALISEPEALSRLSAHGMALVDGEGTYRVVEVLNCFRLN